MTLHTRLAALERRHPAGAVIVLDEADREPGEGRAWHAGHLPAIAVGYAQRGESAKAWAARGQVVDGLLAEISRG